MEIQNLFAEIPEKMPAEVFDILVRSAHVRIERILSRGHASPEGDWYDQKDHEWVVLLRGSAGLRFAGEEKTVTLRPGDHLLIPARRRHRVEWTDPNGDTVWLAVHYPADSVSSP